MIIYSKIDYFWEFAKTVNLWWTLTIFRYSLLICVYLITLFLLFPSFIALFLPPLLWSEGLIFRLVWLKFLNREKVKIPVPVDNINWQPDQFGTSECIITSHSPNEAIQLVWKGKASIVKVHFLLEVLVRFRLIFCFSFRLNFRSIVQ